MLGLMPKPQASGALAPVGSGVGGCARLEPAEIASRWRKRHGARSRTIDIFDCTDQSRRRRPACIGRNDDAPDQHHVRLEPFVGVVGRELPAPHEVDALDLGEVATEVGTDRRRRLPVQRDRGRRARTEHVRRGHRISDRSGLRVRRLARIARHVAAIHPAVRRRRLRAVRRQYRRPAGVGLRRIRGQRANRWGGGRHLPGDRQRSRFGDAYRVARKHGVAAHADRLFDCRAYVADARAIRPLVHRRSVRARRGQREGRVDCGDELEATRTHEGAPPVGGGVPGAPARSRSPSRCPLHPYPRCCSHEGRRALRPAVDQRASTTSSR